MKILITALVVYACSAGAYTGWLEWDRSPSPTVGSYNIYEAKNPTNDLSSFPAGWTLIAQVLGGDNFYRGPNFDGNPHRYTVTAYSGIFESEPSNFIDAPVRPEPPTNLRVVLP